MNTDFYVSITPMVDPAVGYTAELERLGDESPSSRAPRAATARLRESSAYLILGQDLACSARGEPIEFLTLMATRLSLRLAAVVAGQGDFVTAGSPGHWTRRLSRAGPDARDHQQNLIHAIRSARLRSVRTRMRASSDCTRISGPRRSAHAPGMMEVGAEPIVTAA